MRSVWVKEKTWPTCSEPLTVGGGVSIEKTSDAVRDARRTGRRPDASHRGIHFASSPSRAGFSGRCRRAGSRRVNGVDDSGIRDRIQKLVSWRIGLAIVMASSISPIHELSQFANYLMDALIRSISSRMSRSAMSDTVCRTTASESRSRTRRVMASIDLGAHDGGRRWRGGPRGACRHGSALLGGEQSREGIGERRERRRVLQRDLRLRRAAGTAGAAASAQRTPRQARSARRVRQATGGFDDRRVLDRRARHRSQDDSTAGASTGDRFNVRRASPGARSDERVSAASASICGNGAVNGRSSAASRRARRIRRLLPIVSGKTAEPIESRLRCGLRSERAPRPVWRLTPSRAPAGQIAESSRSKYESRSAGGGAGESASPAADRCCDERRRRRALWPAQQFLDAADDQLRLERLGEHAVAAGVVGARLIDRLERAGQQHDRNVREPGRLA